MGGECSIRRPKSLDPFVSSQARDEADLWRVRVAVGVYALAVLYVWYMRVGRLLGLHWILGTLWRLVVGVAGTGSGEGHQDVGPSVDAHGEDLGGASGEEGSGESLLATATTATEEETAAEETATETSTTTEWTTTTETTPLLDGDVAEAAPDWAEHNHSSSLSSSSSSSLVWEAENDGWGSVAIEREPAATDAPTTTDLDTASSFETAPLSDAAVGENAEPRDDL